MMANTIAFSLGFIFLFGDHSLFSLRGGLAIGGVILANCAAVQLLIAGREQRERLFRIGIIPILGYLLAYLLLSRTHYSPLAFMIYCYSLIAGVLLLIITIAKKKA